MQAAIRVRLEEISRSGKRLPTDRPRVIGVGVAGFSANGRGGELPAPTSELSKAFARAIKRVRATGRHSHLTEKHWR